MKIVEVLAMMARTCSEVILQIGTYSKHKKGWFTSTLYSVKPWKSRSDTSIKLSSKIMNGLSILSSHSFFVEWNEESISQAHVMDRTEVNEWKSMNGYLFIPNSIGSRLLWLKINLEWQVGNSFSLFSTRGDEEQGAWLMMLIELELWI